MVDVDFMHRAYKGLVDDFGMKYVHWCNIKLPATLRGGVAFQPCCSTSAESVAKVRRAMHNWICGRSWRVDAENRWMHLDDLARRFLVGCLPCDLIVRIIRDLQTVWSVDASLETALTNALRTNPEDWTSRRKLRVLRIAKTLCQPRVPQLLAIASVTHGTINLVLHELLGGGKDRPRITLHEMIFPDTSPVVAAHAKFIEVMQNWSSSNVLLNLLTLLGCDYADASLRLRARAHFLRGDAGLAQFFTFRMSRPPYSCVRIQFEDEMDQGMIDLAVNDLFTTPLECLPHMCREWRRRYKTRAMFVRDGPEAVWQWATSTKLLIDFSERSHGQMRQSLKSKGPGKDRTMAVDHMVCRQLHAEHMQRPSASEPTAIAVMDVAREKVNDLGAASSSSSTLVHWGKSKDQAACGRKRKGLASPAVTFANNYRQSYKQLHSPGAKLTRDQMEDLEQKIAKEWDAISQSPEGYEAWKHESHAQRQEKLHNILGPTLKKRRRRARPSVAHGTHRATLACRWTRTSLVTGAGKTGVRATGKT